MDRPGTRRNPREPLPPLPVLSPEALETGKRRLLEALEPGVGIWVFGYGSLMWDPGFEHEDALPALLYGYHRSFCVYSHRYRGTPECPGLVLGLDRGGSCHGMVYRIARERARSAMDYLWDREMVTGVYEPRRVKVRHAEGDIRCWTFVADHRHVQYAGRLDTEDTVGLILQGYGGKGHCSDYLANTVRHLDELGIGDGPLHRLHAIVEARRTAALRP